MTDKQPPDFVIILTITRHARQAVVRSLQREVCNPIFHLAEGYRQAPLFPLDRKRGSLYLQASLCPVRLAVRTRPSHG